MRPICQFYMHGEGANDELENFSNVALSHVHSVRQFSTNLANLGSLKGDQCVKNVFVRLCIEFHPKKTQYIYIYIYIYI